MVISRQVCAHHFSFKRYNSYSSFRRNCILNYGWSQRVHSLVHVVIAICDFYHFILILTKDIFWGNSTWSLNLALNSNASESPPTTNRENPKRNPQLISDTVPLETEKSHWTREGNERPYGIRRRTVLYL